jgi:hypothetical protein
MNNAIWISWYDLPDEKRDDYCAWLHGSHLPALLRRPGYQWAAHYAAVPRDQARTIRRNDAEEFGGDPDLPRGYHYLLLIGGEHADVFGNPAPGALHAGLPRADRDMLALRRGERVNVMVEAHRVNNSDAKLVAAAGMLAPCIQLGNFNYPWQQEEELLAWFTQWRMPAIVKSPGCVRVRKMVSAAGWAKHGIIYEWTSVDARNRGYLTHEDGHPEMKAWSDKVVGRTEHAPGSATLASRLWPPVDQETT